MDDPQDGDRELCEMFTMCRYNSNNLYKVKLTSMKYDYQS